MRPFLLLILLTLVFGFQPPSVLRVACIGDSITEGSGLAWEARDAYPAVLDSILGPDFAVLNCGRTTTTLLRDGNLPYWFQNEFHNVFVYTPDIITIKLGTNDTKPYNWNAKSFERDYQALIDTLQTIPGPPAIYCCLPVPVFIDRWGINNGTLVKGVIPIIKRVAAANKLPVIDLYTPLLGHDDEFPDGVHPGPEGTRNIARLMAEAIKKGHK